MGIGLLQPWHLIVILVIILIVFGPGKLPDLGSSLGRGIREFKQGVGGNKESVDDATAKADTTAALPESETTPSRRV